MGKAMVLDMDLAVASIVRSLKENDLYNDTIIIFTSDNGGAISHGASNWPLRGTKGTLFEGGTRAPTFIHGPGVLGEEQSGKVSNKLTHITDWMPTLLHLAGHKGDSKLSFGLDGVDQWDAIRGGEEAREEMVYNLKVGPMSGAVRLGPHKILFGKKFNKQGWYDTDNTALQCDRLVKNKKAKRKNKFKEAETAGVREGRGVVYEYHERIGPKKKKNNLKKKNNTQKRRDKRKKKIDYRHQKIERKQTK